MRLLDDDVCNFCKYKQEDVSHVYFECELIQEFWQKVEQFLNTHLHINLTLSKFAIMFGVHTVHHIINHVILLA